MSRPRNVLPAGLVLAGLALASLALATVALPAAAQTPPARIGNVYDGTAHEPSAPNVQSSEKAAGVAPSPATATKEDDTIRQIDKQLLGNKDNLSNPNAPR